MTSARVFVAKGALRIGNGANFDRRCRPRPGTVLAESCSMNATLPVLSVSNAYRSSASPAQAAGFVSTSAGSASVGAPGAASTGVKPRGISAALLAAKPVDHSAKQPAAGNSGATALPLIGNPPPLPASASVPADAAPANVTNLTDAARVAGAARGTRLMPAPLPAHAAAAANAMPSAGNVASAAASAAATMSPSRAAALAAAWARAGAVPSTGLRYLASAAAATAGS